VRGAALEIHAGGTARALLLEHGLRSELFGTVVGASGGAKWLVLAALDRVLFPWLMSRNATPLACVGSSIGTWRNLCLTQPDPAAASARFLEAYIGQTYTRQPTPAEVCAVSRKILGHAIGAEGPQHVIEHALLQTHIVTARGRGPWNSQRRLPLMAATAGIVASNLLSRDTLGWWLERGCFHTHPARRPLQFTRLPTRYRALNEGNLLDAAVASGSIPLLAEGMERLVPGEMHWDGGMTDYHFEPSFPGTPGLVLYPHFYPFMAPGWFDKPLRWRRTTVKRWPRLVVLCPSREFIARLPRGQIPDRRDFHRLPTAERQRLWTQVADASQRLADEFAQLCAGRGLAAALAAQA
jgi:hypothetical protein